MPRVMLDDIVHEEVAAAVPPGTIFVDVTLDESKGDRPNHDHAYWRMLAEIWAKGEDFAIIEHDVICRPDVAEQFDACPEPWCVFSYANMCHDACREAWANMLGATRFRAELIAAVPDALTSITKPEHLDWHNVCDGLGLNLRAAGYKHHWHTPHVAHHPWFASR